MVNEVSTAAHSTPWSTSDLIWLATPTPAQGKASHFARSGSAVFVSNAFLAPKMKSAFCATINCVFFGRTVERLSHEHTVLNASSSVDPCTFKLFNSVFLGLVLSNPSNRLDASE